MSTITNFSYILIVLLCVILSACSNDTGFYTSQIELIDQNEPDFVLTKQTQIAGFYSFDLIKKQLTPVNGREFLDNELAIKVANGAYIQASDDGNPYLVRKIGNCSTLQVTDDSGKVTNIFYKVKRIERNNVLLSLSPSDCHAENEKSESEIYYVLATISQNGDNQLVEIPLLNTPNYNDEDMNKDLSEWVSSLGFINKILYGVSKKEESKRSKNKKKDSQTYVIEDVDGVVAFLQFLQDKYGNKDEIMRIKIGDFDRQLSNQITTAISNRKEYIESVKQIEEKARIAAAEKERAEAKRQKEAELARQREEAERRRLASLPKIKAGNTYYNVNVSYSLNVVTLTKYQPASMFSKYSYEEIMVYTKGSNRSDQGVDGIRYDRGEIMSKLTLFENSQQFRLDSVKQNYDEQRQCSKWHEPDMFHPILEPSENDVISPKGNMWAFTGGHLPRQKDDYKYCSIIIYDRNNCRIHDCNAYEYASSFGSGKSYLFDNYDDALQKYNSTTMY